jgi:hypothetical protein
MTARWLCLAAIVAALSGCVTKQYGRQEALTDRDRQLMACSDIDRDLVQVAGWQQQVDRRSQFDGWDALAVLGDFGVGNSIERGEALKSAELRTDQLRELRVAKGCTGPVVGQATPLR